MDHNNYTLNAHLSVFVHQNIISKDTAYFASTYLECIENSQCQHYCGSTQRPYCSTDGHCYCEAIGKFIDKREFATQLLCIGGELVLNFQAGNTSNS